MAVLKQRIASLEYKEKWQWKALIKKRNDLDNERMELQKVIISKAKLNRVN